VRRIWALCKTQTAAVAGLRNGALVDNFRPMPNRFDLLRLAAALAVFAGHGAILYHLHFIVPLPGHSLGSLAVYVFFFISGYLVCQSWQRDPQWGRFWLRRALRIFPGLAVAVAFSVLLGWAVTTLPTGQYWSAAGTWLNLVNNMAALATVQTLPGVFEGNPFARAVNGSLWTIRYELMMYCVLAALAWGAQVLCAASGSTPRWIFPLCTMVLAALWHVAAASGWDAALHSLDEAGNPLAALFRWADFCAFGVPFFMGAAMAAYAVRPRGWMGAVALLACAFAALTFDALARQIAVWILVGCGVFYAAHAGLAAAHPHGAQQARPARRWSVDLSYGVYIYAFPLQQAAVELCLRRQWSFAACMALSLAATLLMAWLSWHLIERPAIDAARRWLAA